jgi:GNAT superfamily N-acetyltransferase
MNVKVERLTPKNRLKAKNILQCAGEDWCWCVAWEVRTWEGWTERSCEENLELRERLWDEGQFHGYVITVRDNPIGWIKVASRATWNKLCEQYSLEPSDEVQTFTCFFLLQAFRGKGLMKKGLQLVIEDLQRSGVTQFEGFPKKGLGENDDGHKWMGTYSLFRDCGFREIGVNDGHYHMSQHISSN